MKIDMHLHTTASDGTWSPEILARNLIHNGIQIFSVTDHDSMENIPLLDSLAQKAGLRFIPGVEINVSYKKDILHVLGYNLNIADRDLGQVISRNTQIAEERDAEIISLLKKNGYPVSMTEYQSYHKQPERGGLKVINYSIDKSVCRTHKDFLILSYNLGYRFNKVGYVSPEEAISAIKRAGGMPVIAHPGARVYDMDYRAIVENMFTQGVEGVECYHPENNIETTSYCLEFCKSRNLYITGGSDCHGEFVKERVLGKPDIRLGQLDIGCLLL